MNAEETENAFSLLGQSQTLLGVILTLVVLCIFLDDSNNFIRKLLTGQTQQYKFALRNLEMEINSTIDAFRKDVSYQKSLEWAKDKSQPSEVRVAAQKLNYYTYLSIFNFQTEISESYPKIDVLLKYNESTRAPLYVFGFAIIIFIIDEIGRFFTGECDWLLYGINVFTISSVVFWSILWFNFVFKASEVENRDTHGKLIRDLLSEIRTIDGVVLKGIIYVVIFYLWITLFPWNALNGWGRVWMSLIAFLIPLLLVGLCRFYMFDKKGFYTHGHILGHLIGVLFYAVLMTLTGVLTGKMEEISGDFLTDIKWTRFLLVMFALLNGLILPYVLPYGKLCLRYSGYREVIEQRRKRIEEGIKDFSNQYKELCANVADTLIRHQ